MISYVEVSVGILPEWYEEPMHGRYLEQAIKEYWENKLGENVEVEVCYNYQTDSGVVEIYNDEDDLVETITNHNLDYAFL